MTEHISSRQNPLVARFRAAASGLDEAILLDGVHLLDDALEAGAALEVVAVLEAADAEAAAAADRARARGMRVVSVSGAVLRAISPVRTPSGIVALAARPASSLARALAAPPQLVFLLADIQDPGNVGAIIRAAEGCGATGVVAGPGTADPYGWKALRGSMGSALRLPLAVRQALPEATAAAQACGLRVYAAVPRGGTPLPACRLAGPAAILLGGEGAGLDADLLARADEQLTIPMRRGVESLNVATAAALIAYEAMRQRDGASV